jgi:hypothetical protein
VLSSPALPSLAGLVGVGSAFRTEQRTYRDLRFRPLPHPYVRGAKCPISTISRRYACCKPEQAAMGARSLMDNVLVTAMQPFAVRERRQPGAISAQPSSRWWLDSYRSLGPNPRQWLDPYQPLPQIVTNSSIRAIRPPKTGKWLDSSRRP